MVTINNVVESGAVADLPPGTPAIEVTQLGKRFGPVVAVDDVSFTVDPGEIFGYLGRNGSGKTTTVRMLATLTRPTSGRARICGTDIADVRAVRRLIGVTMQDAALDDAMTAAEHLRFVAGMSGLGRAEARRLAAEVLEVVGLAQDAAARIGAYSGGMKRRLDIASALIDRPPVLFLDEPSTGLDPQSRRAVWDEVRALQASGVTVFLTTQYLEGADQLAGRLAIIDAGAIVAEGSPRDLKAEHGRTTITVAHDGDANRDPKRTRPAPRREGGHRLLRTYGRHPRHRRGRPAGAAPAGQAHSGGDLPHPTGRDRDQPGRRHHPADRCRHRSSGGSSRQDAR